jgi:hypothetical protein
MLPSEKGRELTWSVFPFKEDLRRSTIVVLIIAVSGIVVYVAFKDVFLAVLSVVILFASLHTYFTRTDYRLDADGIEIKTSLAKTARKWSHFKRFHADRKGITLSPFAKPSRLEPFRSVRLLYGGNKEDVVEFVSKNIGGTPAADTG